MLNPGRLQITVKVEIRTSHTLSIVCRELLTCSNGSTAMATSPEAGTAVTVRAAILQLGPFMA